MAKNKYRKKTSKNPNEFLRLTSLSPDLEEIARDLYEKACCGSRSLWKTEFKESIPDYKNEFVKLSHKGMKAAQNIIINEVLNTNELSASQKILFRGIADSIAWQLLGGQLCHARRLYKGHNQPNLNECNFKSAVSTVENIEKEKPYDMPLISDLTSFIQVGDIFSMGINGQLSLIELKEGKVNHKITEFLDFYSKSKCDFSLQMFVKNEDASVIKQMNRMIRQSERMSHISDVMNSGRGRDPDTEEHIFIPNEVIYGDYWNKELNDVIDRSNTKGWGLDVIDDCLYIACYRNDLMLHSGHVMFNSWFNMTGANPSDMKIRLFNCMQSPLALPLFMREIPNESMFDLLFGRLQICIGIKLDAFLKQCQKSGLNVRIASNKETTQLRQKGISPILQNKLAVFIGNGTTEIILLGGIFFRAIFHSQKPLSVINSVLSLPSGKKTIK